MLPVDGSGFSPHSAGRRVRSRASSCSSDGGDDDDDPSEDSEADQSDLDDLSCYQSLRRATRQFLESSPEAPQSLRRLAVAYQFGFAVMVIALFVVDSTTAPTVTTSLYWHTELVLTIVWVTEYMLRLWSCVEKVAPEEDGVLCKARWRQATSWAMLLDLFSLVSLCIDLCIESNSYRGVAALRMLRLLTLFRIERDFKIFSPVLVVLHDKRAQLVATLGIAVLVLSVASVIMFYVEAPTNPAFGSVLTSMWWCTTALTTVGYGDIVPESGLGRFVACVVAFIGTGMFGLFAGILADGFREALRRDRRFRSQQRIEERAVSSTKLEEHPLVLFLEERLKAHEDRVVSHMDALREEVGALRSEVQAALALSRGQTSSAADSTSPANAGAVAAVGGG